MIKTEGLSKHFNDVKALDNITVDIRKGSIFGLVGTNGAGKSTFLRVAAGILKADSGTVTIDGEPVFENTALKERLFYISDDQFFFPNCTPKDVAAYFSRIYHSWQQETFDRLLKNFELPQARKVNTFSKGMRKQLSVIAALSAKTDYILCDETFDGLDPVMRQGVKSLFAAEVAARDFTPVIASHNLRELEDICDHVGLLHKGGVILSRDLDEMKISLHKIQAIFNEAETPSFPELEIVSLEQRGSLFTIVARGSQEDITARVAQKKPLFMEVLPLTLEEIFISETEEYGYDIKKLLV